MSTQDYQGTLTWTAPGEIDGEPHDVRELTVQQLREFANAAAQLALDSVIQIRNAGITGKPGRNVDEVSLETWLESEEAAACRDLVAGSRQLLAGVKRLEAYDH